MSKVVSISPWKFLLGAVATVAVPAVFYCAIGGPVPPLLFVNIVQAGVIIGLVNYIRSPAVFASIKETPTTSQDDTTER
jgi:hypothetical protein